MTCDDSFAYAGGESDDFQRFYFGGSPPESDGWERHAFEDAFQGKPCAAVQCARKAASETASLVDFLVDEHREPLATA